MQLKINRNLELGILAIDALRNESTAKNTADLALEIGTSDLFLQQIMRKLRVAGIVSSVRGPGGGYLLVGCKSFTAHDIAVAIGCDMPSPDLSLETPVDTLKLAVLEAYMNVRV